MSTNTGRMKEIKEMMNGLGGISQASQGQTGAERAMGMAKTAEAIMALLA